jgi:formyl-CoA transferase
VSAWCRERTKIEAMEELQDAGVPAGAVLSMQELTDDPQLRRRGMFATIEHPVRGPITMPAWPVKLSESEVPVRTSPLLGQHTEEVLSEWLGMSRQEIEAFRKESSAPI